MFINCLDSEEISEAQRTNKPSGKCQYCLMISKTCQEAKKSIPARGPATKMPIFVNAEEEFFYEVQTNIQFISITFVNMNISVQYYSYGSNGLFCFVFFVNHSKLWWSFTTRSRRKLIHVTQDDGRSMMYLWNPSGQCVWSPWTECQQLWASWRTFSQSEYITTHFISLTCPSLSFPYNTPKTEGLLHGHSQGRHVQVLCVEIISVRTSKSGERPQLNTFYQDYRVGWNLLFTIWYDPISVLQSCCWTCLQN